MRNVLQTSPRTGSEPDVARIISLSELGFIAEQRGDPGAARSRHLECLTTARKLGDPQAVARALTGLAGAQALADQPDRAAQLLGAADTACRSAGVDVPPGDNADVNRITAMTRRALGEAAFTAGFQNGRRLRPEQAASLLRRAATTRRSPRPWSSPNEPAGAARDGFLPGRPVLRHPWHRLAQPAAVPVSASSRWRIPASCVSARRLCIRDDGSAPVWGDRRAQKCNRSRGSLSGAAPATRAE